MIDERHEPRLADFGLSKLMTEPDVNGNTTTLTSEFKGSLRWMSRERLGFSDHTDSMGVTYESDIWAFGMTVLVRVILHRSCDHPLILF